MKMKFLDKMINKYTDDGQSVSGETIDAYNRLNNTNAEFTNTLLGSNKEMFSKTMSESILSPSDASARKAQAIGNKAKERQKQQSILGGGASSTSILGGGLY